MNCIGFHLSVDQLVSPTTCNLDSIFVHMFFGGYKMASNCTYLHIRVQEKCRLQMVQFPVNLRVDLVYSLRIDLGNSCKTREKIPVAQYLHVYNVDA